MRIVGTALLIAVAVVWSGLILVLYFTTYPLNLGHSFRLFVSAFERPYASVPIWYLRDLAFLGVVLVAAWTVGGFVLRLLKPEGLSAPEKHVFSIIIGLEGLALLTFLFGVAGLLYSGIFYSWIFLVCAAGVPRLIATFKSPRSAAKREGPSRLDRVLIVLLALLFLLGFLYALAPPVQSDGLRYHLAAPQEYLKHHRIHYLPFNAFSNFPFLIEMLFTLGMLLSSDVLAKLIHFCCLILTCCLLATMWKRFLRRSGSEATAKGSLRAVTCSPGVLGITIFAATPAALIVSCWSFIDAGIVLFFTAMLYSLLLWVQAGERRYLWLLGITAGGALGTKYTMLVFVLLALAVVFCLSLIMRSKGAGGSRLFHDALKNTLIPAGIALALASPWYVKNVISTGNPVYPLAYGVFDGGDWSRANDTFYRAKAAEKGFPRTVKSCLTSPFDTAFYWAQFEAFNIGVGYLLFAPFLCAFPVWLWRKKLLSRVEIVLFLFAIAHSLLWYFTYQSNRFLIPLFAILALLIVHFLENMKNVSPALYVLLLAALLAATLHNAAWSARWILAEASPPPLPVVLGFQGRDAYLARALDYYPYCDYLNTHVRKGDKVLFIGEHRGYYCRAEYLASDWFDTPYILHLIRQTGSNDELFEWLESHAVRYVFFNYRELRLYVQAYFKPRFTAAEYERFLDFARSPHLKRVFSLAEDMYICEISNK